MLVYIIFAIALVCLAIYCYSFWRDGYSTLSEKIFIPIIMLFVGAFISSAVIVASYFVVGIFADGPTTHYHWDLRQISTAQGVQGRFFLGTGYINGEQQFVGYYESGGGLRMGTFPADDTLVIERDGVKPELIENDHYGPTWAMPASWQNKLDFYDYDFTIIVPKGSIASDINLNLK